MMIVFKKSLGPKGLAIGITIPNEILEWMELKSGDELLLIPDDFEGGKRIIMKKEEVV